MVCVALADENPQENGFFRKFHNRLSWGNAKRRAWSQAHRSYYRTANGRHNRIRRGLMSADADTKLIQRLSRSQIFADYQKAFGEATELPLTLRAAETWRLAHRDQAHENAFCAMLARTNGTCAVCLEVQQRAVDGAPQRPATVVCFAGLCDTAVPIKLGERTIGFLQTGQVACEAP